MALLSNIRVQGINVPVSPTIEVIQANAPAIQAFIEGIWGGVFAGNVSVSISADLVDPLMEITIGASPYEIDQLSTIDPVNTYSFTQSDCSSTEILVSGPCLDGSLTDALVASLKKDFPTCCRGNAQSAVGSGEVVAVALIYYGNLGVEGDPSPNAAAIEALGSISDSSLSGSYAFTATLPSQRKYVAAPASFGLPTKVYNPSTGLDIPLSTVYQVTIDGVVYNVFETFYYIGGELIMTFI
jgi:hypothetical protein